MNSIYWTRNLFFWELNSATAVIQNVNTLLIPLIFRNALCINIYINSLVFNWPFDLEGEAYALLFPKVIYPINNISLTCSTYITVIIAYER